MSQIAIKGFFAGYFSKEAELSLQIPGQYNPDPATDRLPGIGGSLKDQPTPVPTAMPGAKTALPGGTTPANLGLGLTGTKGKYDDILALLKNVAPGAATGAAVVGGASALAGAGSKGNLRRSLLLALLAGAPLGAAAQLYSQGGLRGLHNAGSTIAGAGRAAAADVGKAVGGALPKKPAAPAVP